MRGHLLIYGGDSRLSLGSWQRKGLAWYSEGNICLWGKAIAVRESRDVINCPLGYDLSYTFAPFFCVAKYISVSSVIEWVNVFRILTAGYFGFNHICFKGVGCVKCEYSQITSLCQWCFNFVRCDGDSFRIGQFLLSYERFASFARLSARPDNGNFVSSILFV